MKIFLLTIVTALITLGHVQAVPDSKAIETLKTATNLASLITEYVAYTGTYPSREEGLTLLVTRPRVAPIPRRWMMLIDELPKDSWGNDFVYSISYVNEEQKEARLGILSKGADGKLDGEDDIFISWVAKLP
jgi:general secretion pathway protein G